MRDYIVTYLEGVLNGQLALGRGLGSDLDLRGLVDLDFISSVRHPGPPMSDNGP
jgi:hypothetical protein